MTIDGLDQNRRRGSARAILCGLLGLALPLPAWAAQPVAPTRLPVMTMQVVRSNDPACAGRCSDWIALQGPMGVGSAATFARLVRSLGSRRLPVLVNSPGGSVRDGMAIGRLIREKHLDVAVSRTVLTSCPGDRTVCEATVVPHGVITGSPLTMNSFCASACSFILAGGERRFVALHTYVGVHQFRSYTKQTRMLRLFRTVTRTVDGERVEVSRTLVSERPISSKEVSIKTPEASYGEAQRYFTTMGITPRLMTLAEETVPASIHWLSLAELVETRMDTEGKDGTFLITHATADVPTRQAQSPQKSAPVTVVVPAQATDPAAAGETAMLTADEAPDQAAIRLAGHVVWSVDETRPVPSLLATIDLPDGAGGATVRFDDAARVPGRPEYRIDLTLQPGPRSPFSGVLTVGAPAVGTGQRPTALPCTVRAPSSGTYTIDLSTDDDAAADQTRRLLAGDGTLTIPLIAASLRKLRLTLERGTAGRDAFQHWRALVDARLPAG